jgi:hypothetical protein
VPPREEKAVPDLKGGDVFYQEVTVSRVSRCSMAGGGFQQNTRYLFVSRFEVQKRTAEGGLVVRQKVEGVRLANADPALQARLNDLLRKSKGATFTWTVNARREVTAFTGPREAPQVFADVKDLGGPSFLLWSFLDADGWKELAQLTLFRPPSPVRKGQKWARAMTHSWGALGSWTGQAAWVHPRQSPRKGLDHFTYALNLGYRPPPRGAGGGLLLEIGNADFRIVRAGGVVAYDQALGRVAAFEEHFHVRGAVAVGALGVNTTVTLDEAQLFQVRLLERNPLRQ